MMGKPLVIIGAGGHAKVVADVAISAGFDVIGFLDDHMEVAPLTGYGVLGCVSMIGELLVKNQELKFIIAIGDNQVRRKLATDLLDWSNRLSTVVHPSASLSSYVELGLGAVVMPHVVVNAGAQIGNHVILNTACTIDHDCSVRQYAHVSPGAHIAGNVLVGEGVHLGVGVSVIPQRIIGAWSVVGAGAVVVEDVPSRVVAVGVPARVIREF
jgi:sugar O-acyltransferase (sialic acid O-acetyltransferase NeuD family)